MMPIYPPPRNLRGKGSDAGRPFRGCLVLGAAIILSAAIILALVFVLLLAFH
jgi:hypothetical protein